MTAFKSPGSFAAHLRQVALALPRAEQRGLEAGAVLIEAEAKAEIGRYQDAAGPFEKWAELAAATKASRSAAGFPPNNPLLVTGELLHSIGHRVEGRKAVVGSTSDLAVYQEFGTIHAAHPIPPRSFLGASGFRKGEAAAQAIGEAVAHVVAGRFGNS